MANPWDAFRRVVRPEPEPEQDSQSQLERRAAAGPSDVRLPCRYCPTPVVRGQYPPYDWYHEDDEIVFTLQESNIMIKSFSNYDHEPQPDVIEAIYLGEE